MDAGAAGEIQNVARRLTATAAAMPEGVAVVEPLGYGPDGRRQYRQVSFRELDTDTDRIARGLAAMGVTPGTRMALLVRPGIDFIALVFGLFKAGAVAILIDPGMGRRNLIRCLAEARPQGFIAIPLAHAIRALLRHRFPEARHLVTVGRRWFWGGKTLEQLRRWGSDENQADHESIAPQAGGRTGATAGLSSSAERPRVGKPPVAPSCCRNGSIFDDGRLAPVTPDDPAAIIFTTGSTGPPKGVLYRHGNFDSQVDQIRDRYGIAPGEIDLPGFPLFALFNCAMGVTTVIPDMDPSRPAQVDPRKIIEAITDWRVTQAFGSPAIWNRVGQHCEEHGIRLPTVRRVLSAGAPVPAHVLRRMGEAIDAAGEVHTPYGATEALPVASISAREVLGETAAATQQGAGVCVGRCFPGIRWKVIQGVDGPIGSIADVVELPGGQIGELIVQGPVVTREYITRVETNAVAKILDPQGLWHRMGDAGYFDAEGRFWFCGRMAHRVLTADGPMYPVQCEGIFNRHPAVFRSALVGVGPPGRQEPVLIVEPKRGALPSSRAAQRQLLAEVQQIGQQHRLTRGIGHFLVHPAFPVDIRHNAKIFREKLAVWAAGQ